MLDLSPEKILALAFVALLVLGPNRLPSAARSIGRLLGQLRAMSASLQSEVGEALKEPTEAFGSAIAELHPNSLRRSVRRTVVDTVMSPPSGPASLGAETSAAADVEAPPPVRLYSSHPAGEGPIHPDDPALN